MTSRIACVTAVLVFSTISLAQNPADRYSIGVALTKGKQPSCPIFIWLVWEKSPAATAGIRTGDILVAVNEAAVHTIRDAAQRIGSQTPGNVVLSVRRASDVLQENGKKLLNDKVIPAWVPEAYQSCFM